MHNLVSDENWFEGSKEFYPWEAKNFIRGKPVRGTAARCESVSTTTFLPLL